MPLWLAVPTASGWRPGVDLRAANQHAVLVEADLAGETVPRHRVVVPPPVGNGHVVEVRDDRVVADDPERRAAVDDHKEQLVEFRAVRGRQDRLVPARVARAKPELDREPIGAVERFARQACQVAVGVVERQRLALAAGRVADRRQRAEPAAPTRRTSPKRSPRRPGARRCSWSRERSFSGLPSDRERPGGPARANKRPRCAPRRPPRFPRRPQAPRR